MYDFFLLRCNRSPGDLEYRCAPEDPNLCDPCTRLSDVLTQSITANLVGWEDDRRMLREHERVLPHLPSEPLAEIFLFCISDDAMAVDLEHASSRTIHALLTLSAVCKRWRDVAHLLSQIWATIFLRPHASKSRSLRIHDLVKEWIGRAGQLSLSINLYISSGCRAEAAIMALMTLFRSSDRWLELKYCGPPSWFTSTSKGKINFPKLRMFHLKDSDSYNSATFDLHPKQRLNALSIHATLLDAVTFDYQSLHSIGYWVGLRL